MRAQINPWNIYTYVTDKHENNKRFENKQESVLPQQNQVSKLEFDYTNYR